MVRCLLRLPSFLPSFSLIFDSRKNITLSLFYIREILLFAVAPDSRYRLALRSLFLTTVKLDMWDTQPIMKKMEIAEVNYNPTYI